MPATGILAVILSHIAFAEGEKPVAENVKNLTCLIQDLRKEFKAPQMKVVVGVMGVNGMLNEVGK